MRLVLSFLEGACALAVCMGLYLVVYYLFFFDVHTALPTAQILGRQIGGWRIENPALVAQRQNGIASGIGFFVMGLMAFIGFTQIRLRVQADK